jgi:hypothetical protein
MVPENSEMYLLLGKILHGAVKFQDVFASWKNTARCSKIPNTKNQFGKILHGAVKFQAVFASWKNPRACKIICMEIFGILRCCVFGKILFHAIAGHQKTHFLYSLLYFKTCFMLKIVYTLA